MRALSSQCNVYCMHAQYILRQLRLSVCLSVCLSITLVVCVKKTERIELILKSQMIPSAYIMLVLGSKQLWS